MKQLLAFAIFSLTLSSLQGCAPVIVAGTVAGAGATLASDRRQPDKIIEDQIIEIQATDYIYSNKEFGKKVRIEVTAFNGTVLLVGESPKETYKDQIIQRIGKMNSVNKVIDNIQVRESLTFNNKSNDFWISSKVKSNLIAHKGLLTRTKVVTSDSTVYLMGLVSNIEAQEIIQIVNRTDGINEVVPLFESLDGSLDPKLQVTSRIAKKSNSPAEKTFQQTLQEEDEIIVQPYVLQPPIQLSNGE